MRNISILLLTVITLLSLSSCLQDHADPVDDTSKEIKVTAFIGSEYNTSTVSTRAKDNTWDKGDAIGIFMKKKGSILAIPSLFDNVKYITDGTSDFTSNLPLYYPFDNNEVDFIAYYPFKETLSGVEYSIDVSEQSNLSNIDLLYSNNVIGADRTTDSVNLKFHHQLTKIILKLSLEDPESAITGLEAEISDIHSKATFLLTDGTIKNPTDIKTIAFKISDDNKIGQAILLPTTSLEDKHLNIRYNKRLYTIDLDKLNIKSFAKGTKYTYNVVIKPKEGFIVGQITTSIEDWINGGSEDITVTEGLPTDEDEGSGTDGGGDTVITDSIPVIDGEAVGNGTKENPYTIAQAKQKEGSTKVWVKGYIVGAYSMYNMTDKAFGLGLIKNSAFNLGIADAFTETNINNIFGVNLDKDFGTIYNIQKSINIYENPKNLHKLICVYGDIKTDHGGLCITNNKQIIMDGVTYK